MLYTSVMIKPSSSNCNLDCKYCFYKVLSSNREEYDMGFMNESKLEETLRNAINSTEKQLIVSFQGGEPTLIGLKYYEKVIEIENRLNTKKIWIQNSIQTNGILINDKWAQFFHDHHFLVGVSLDGPQEIHDRYRHDLRNSGTFDRVMKSIECLRKHDVEFNILTVITNESYRHAKKIYNYFKENDFQFIQIIPCIDDDCHEYSITGKQYGQFLCEIFELWYKDFINGTALDIRIFSNYLQMLMGYYPEQCGLLGRCFCGLIIEGNGDVYPCDFYCTDEWKLGNVTTSFEQLMASDQAKRFVESSLSVDSECKECKYYQICRGGCRRYRDQKEALVKNKLCDGYKMFFDQCLDRLIILSKNIRRNMGK